MPLAFPPAQARCSHVTLPPRPSPARPRPPRGRLPKSGGSGRAGGGREGTRGHGGGPGGAGRPLGACTRPRGSAVGEGRARRPGAVRTRGPRRNASPAVAESGAWSVELWPRSGTGHASRGVWVDAEASAVCAERAAAGLPGGGTESGEGRAGRGGREGPAARRRRRGPSGVSPLSCEVCRRSLWLGEQLLPARPDAHARPSCQSACSTVGFRRARLPHPTPPLNFPSS